MAKSDSERGPFGAWGVNILGSDEKERLRDAIAADRAAMAAFVPDACLLPTYVGYLEALTYADVAITLFDTFELEAATTVQRMVSAKLDSLEPEALAACL